MKNRITIGLLVLFSSTLVSAQDTLKVGINDQLIQVEAPENNQKVTVLIEDSTFTYKVEISKLENISVLDQQFEGVNTKKGTRAKKKSNFSSSWFNSYEVGLNTLAFKQKREAVLAYSFNIDSASQISEREHSNRSFASSGEFWGAYLDFTIRDRKKSSKKAEGLYAKRKSHIRLDYNSTNGKVYKSVYYGAGNVNSDSLVSETSVDRRVNLTYLQLSQLFAYGWDINKDKNISLEYGVNFGLQMKIKVASTDNNNGTLIRESEGFVNVLENFVNDPWIKVQHHLAFNYDKYSLNIKSTMLDKRFGNVNRKNVKAKVLSVGVGYTF